MECYNIKQGRCNDYLQSELKHQYCDKLAFILILEQRITNSRLCHTNFKSGAGIQRHLKERIRSGRFIEVRWGRLKYVLVVGLVLLLYDFRGYRGDGGGDNGGAGARCLNWGGYRSRGGH